jgi:chlorobactene glucosyltransferase
VILLGTLAVLGCLGKAWGAYNTGRITRGRWHLAAAPPSVRPTARVSVCVPARNEAHNLPRLLASLNAQDHEDLEVIVVDDHSTDGTAEVAARHGVRVVRGEPLPDGWMGKNWACWQAAQASTGDILLFVDADTVHEPAAVRTVAALLEDADVAAVIGRQTLGTLGEQLVAAYFWAALLSLISPERAEDPSRPEDAMGNGQFCAYRRAIYDACGGHAGIRDVIIEDVALVRRAKHAGGRYRFRFGPELTATRMYHGLAETWRGFAKNVAFISPDHRVRDTLLTLTGVAIGFQMELLPYVLLPRGGWLAGVAGAHIVAIFLGRWWLYRRVCAPGISPLAYVLQPLGALVGLAITLHALVLGLGAGATWKGRRVKGRPL